MATTMLHVRTTHTCALTMSVRLLKGFGPARVVGCEKTACLPSCPGTIGYSILQTTAGGQTRVFQPRSRVRIVCGWVCMVRASVVAAVAGGEGRWCGALESSVVCCGS